VPAFRFRLDALLRYRRHRRELVQRLFAQIQADDDALVARRLDLERQRERQLAEVRDLSQAGVVDVDRASARRFYAVQLSGDIRVVEHNRRILAEQLRLCRQALTKADQEVKVLEKLEEKQRVEHAHADEQRSARELEDAWMAARVGEFAR
jgi:flagellar protein FliJ